MKNNLTHASLKGDYVARLRLQGMGVFNGVLKNINQTECSVEMDCNAEEGTRCFLWIQVKDAEHYSRGNIVKSDFHRVTIRIENGLSLYRIIARHEILLEDSTLKQLIRAQSYQNVIGVVDTRQDSSDRKLNCWEANKCGKENYCVAGTSVKFDGLFGGKNGGRFCAFIDETLCKNGRPLTGEKKLVKCSECDFFYEILRDATIDQGQYA
ncbi:MAG: hypothetical protein HQL77_10495 [Magnetococcales bacterium]|nr:hypothetical protein [Magnetococcales bacterium]